MTGRRLRISHLVVTPVLVWDDGEELTPGPDAHPKAVPLTGLAAMADLLRAEVAQLNAQAADAAGSDSAI